MEDIYSRIYQGLTEMGIEPAKLKPGDYKKSVSNGFMDLHLDVLAKTEKEVRIALAHNYQQNGDTIADPDMEIRIYLLPDWKKAEALTYQDYYDFQRVYDEDEKTVNIKAKKELNDFLLQWLHNLKQQGHKFN